MCAKKMGKKKKKPRFKVMKLILITILSIMIFASVAVAGIVLAIIKTAPEVDLNSILSLNEPSTLYDDKGNFMDIVITDENRTVISFKDMPQDLKNAFVSIEDERFYKHNGIDIRRIGGAVYTNLMKKLKKQPGLHGASTITQQLIKRTMLTPEVTFKRKIQEMYMSIQLEKHLSKDQILEAYMNNIFLGGRSYGVEAAANEYFSKKASELNLIECAFIAGMPQSPSVNYPFSPSAKKDPFTYIDRTKSVLKKMLENGYISNQQCDQAIKDLDVSVYLLPKNLNNAKAVLDKYSIPSKIEESKYLVSTVDKKDLFLYLELPDNNADQAIAVLQQSPNKGELKNLIKVDTNIIGILEKPNTVDNIVKTLNKEKININYVPFRTKGLVFQQPPTNNNKLNNEWFSLPAIEAVKADLKAQYNYSNDEVNQLLMYGGLKIYSTMNTELQNAAQKILDDDKNLGITSTRDANGIVQPQASASIIDYHTGEVKVIIGGRGSQPPRSYNRAAFNGSKEFLRPSGSSIKPITVYSASIDSKAATAGTVIDDAPVSEQIIKKYDPSLSWKPRNYETGSFSGLVTIREAITRSINVVAIKLVDQIGLKTSAEYAEKFGLTLDNHDKTSISALSLGQLHHGTNTLTMAAAYGTFGNGGNYTKPILYTKVVDRTGKTILEGKTTTKQILSPQNAYVMYDLLKGPIEGYGGTAPNAKFGDIDVRGKTGTSGDKKDFWFCGLTPYYSGSIWIGNDVPKETYSIYSSTSAGLWAKIMAEAHKNLKNKEISAPSGIVTAPICKLSGKLPTDLCSKDKNGNMVYTEIFAEGTIPTELCDIHTESKMNVPTDKTNETSTSTPNSTTGDNKLNNENKPNTPNNTTGKTELDTVKEEEEDINSSNSTKKNNNNNKQNNTDANTSNTNNKQKNTNSQKSTN